MAASTQALQSVGSPTRRLKSNFMSALSQSTELERPSTPALSAASDDMVSLASSPDGSSSSSSVGFIEMSDLMLPASALESELFGVPQDSSATVVSSASCDETSSDACSMTTHKLKQRKAPSSERRHSLPSTLMLSSSQLGGAVTQPVPEFLCHLFSMLRDPSYSDMIAWVVPSADEPDHQGGGLARKGKIVVHQPESLQDSVLGRYYRHSKYASFQRQLNYFGFKKRLHGGKKGKLSPCSYIHDLLTEDVESLFGLKRRPPSKKRASSDASDADCATSVSSDECKRSKKRRVSVEKKPVKKVAKGKKERKGKRQGGGKQQVLVTSVPKQVLAEEYGPPTVQSASAIETNQFRAQQPVTSSTFTAPAANNLVRTVTSTATNELMKPAQQACTTHTAAQPPTSSQPPVPQPTLLELLSTSLPPSDVLFNDSVDCGMLDGDGIPTWVTDDGQYHYHNVDSSLVDLAMLY